MHPSGGDMPGMPHSMLNGSAPQLALRELQNGQPQQQQQQQQQRQPAPGSALQDYDHSAAAAHDDFFDQMLSSLPWVELNPANSKSPWDLASANGGKPAMDQEQPAAAEGLHYAAPPYDESVLLASRLRQHQISGGGGSGPPGPGKPAIGPLHLNHASQQQQQQHMLVAGIGRSAVESGLLPLPLSLGIGADSRLPMDRSRGDHVDASFKTLTSAVVGDGLFNRFGGEQQRSAPSDAANHQSFHHPHVTASPLLQELVPNVNKTDKATMLDEIIDYVKFLQLQVKMEDYLLTFKMPCLCFLSWRRWKLAKTVLLQPSKH